jgi:hypothetical protein
VRLPQRPHRRGARRHRPGRGHGPAQPPHVRGGRAGARRRRRGPAREARSSCRRDDREGRGGRAVAPGSWRRRRARVCVALRGKRK